MTCVAVVAQNKMTSAEQNDNGFLLSTDYFGRLPIKESQCSPRGDDSIQAL